ncbi:hypothetical protein N7533_011387 [Penicillium manginii]|uniref:uncharacterized protein n=1 Tax=Penicillium manginii TaxID=203109 RepID=UPI002546F999|nr:uncharacterized protein N7533_011387 [Penicillium manginii]KAJ5741978.1 hypothetical protein N7533_011387 [Penicillium manginii]
MINDKGFKDHILKPHCEDVRDELMKILIPLMDQSKIEDNRKNIGSQAYFMLEHAFDLRASCIPSPTERFEIVHYRPGDLFNAETMRVENIHGQEVNPPDVAGGEHRIKICVHGLMLAHQVEETARGIEFLKVMGQPFLESDQEVMLKGRIVSEKACVILETQI